MCVFGIPWLAAILNIPPVHHSLKSTRWPSTRRKRQSCTALGGLGDAGSERVILEAEEPCQGLQGFAVCIVMFSSVRDVFPASTCLIAFYSWGSLITFHSGEEKVEHALAAKSRVLWWSLMYFGFGSNMPFFLQTVSLLAFCILLYSRNHGAATSCH